MIAQATRPLPRLVPRAWRQLLAGAVVLALVLGGAWLWLRDSSLVAVKRVTVTGVSGPDAARIRAALARAARNMTTLDVDNGQLHTAVAPYPVVKGLQVITQFPHGIRIRVIEQIPVGELSIGGRSVAVAGDGTLLRDMRVSGQLPLIAVGEPPGGARVTERGQAQAVALLAAAPYQLLSHVAQVTTSAQHGLVAQLRGGPSIYFGDARQLHAKWIAASAVLANGGSAGAQYIDVTDPQRPAAGVVASSSSASGAGSSSTGAASASPTSTTAPPGR